MLAPLVRWRPADPAADDSPNEFPHALCVGRGQLLGLSGPDSLTAIEGLTAAAGETGTAAHARVAISDPASLAAATLRVAVEQQTRLWLILIDPAAAQEDFNPLLVELEKCAQAGGGALLAGDPLPELAALSGRIEWPLQAPDFPADRGILLDDQGLPVRSLRRGEWATVAFTKTPQSAEQRKLSLVIQGKSRQWRSKPASPQDWLPNGAAPGRLVAQFAVPCPPGDYQIQLESRGGRRGAPQTGASVALQVRAQTAWPAPEELAVDWRVFPLAPVPRFPAALALACPELIATRRLTGDLSLIGGIGEDGGSLPPNPPPVSLPADGLRFAVPGDGRLLQFTFTKGTGGQSPPEVLGISWDGHSGSGLLRSGATALELELKAPVDGQVHELRIAPLTRLSVGVELTTLQETPIGGGKHRA